MTVRVRLTFTGVVQGVGFRPHVHRLATQRRLAGHVGNDSTSVFVELEGDAADIEWVRERIVSDAPPLSQIDSISAEVVPPTGGVGFEIVASRTAVGERTLVAPDVAVCDDCCAELADAGDHRYRYPFITCTNCGPRFTIIRGLPYDRPNTTMAGFAMCAHCARQYADPGDRRFHAQPLACFECGPQLAYRAEASVLEAVDRSTSDEVIAAVQRDLGSGAIVAIKGLGGYHLACDATDDDAVARLRQRKGRVDKPFAVMVADVAVARSIVVVDDVEAATLTSPARPIVLLTGRSAVVSPLVAPSNPLIGVMLPYAPLHHLLFRAVPGHDSPTPRALVMTSGNVSNEPLAFDDGDARRRLAGLADSFCTHDRPIRVPCDDSVLRVVDGREVPIRRSRGFAPLPVRLPAEVAPTLAVGAELKNTFCLADGTHAWVSQHIGDMENVETLEAFSRSVELLDDLYGVGPGTLAADAHPGYMTHHWAHERAEAPHLVQHHHAHVGALMAEAGLGAGERVIGVAFDGTGYGTDGAIWGGEFLLAGYDGFERFAALADVPLPGGDSAIRKPYRVALAHLWAAGIEWGAALAPVVACGDDERAALASMLHSGLRCVPTSSMGRLFDAVSSLLGIRHEVTYEAQAAIELEHLASQASAGEHRRLRYSVGADGRIDVADVLAGLVAGLALGEAVPGLAAAFHDATAAMVVDVATRARSESGLDTVALTGGVFQNALLVESTRRALEKAGFVVLTHRLVPPNDGGLALGQAIIAGLAARA